LAEKPSQFLVTVGPFHKQLSELYHAAIPSSASCYAQFNLSRQSPCPCEQYYDAQA
jgi:hypothetical protein